MLKGKDMSEANNLKPYIAGVIFTFIVGFSFLMIKICVPYADTVQIMTYRFDFAMIAVAAVLAAGHRRSSGTPFSGKKVLLIPASFYIACLALQTFGLRYSTSIEATIIFAVSPLIVQVISSLFLKEKSTVLQWLLVMASAAALIAMVAIGNKISMNAVGVALLLLAAVLMAVYTVTARHFRKAGSPMDMTAVIVAEGFIAFNAVSVSTCAAAGDPLSYFAPLFHWQFAAATAYLGIGCIMLSAQMMNYMLSSLHAVNASIFGNASTLVTIMAGALILGEQLHVYQVICAAVILGAVIGISVDGEKQRRLEAINGH
jgi:drug/metabolite transporter (DMT)-like permease